LDANLSLLPNPVQRGVLMFLKSADGTRLLVEETGDGTPLILVQFLAAHSRPVRTNGM